MLVWVEGFIIIMMATKRVMMIMVETTLVTSMSRTIMMMMTIIMMTIVMIMMRMTYWRYGKDDIMMTIMLARNSTNERANKAKGDVIINDVIMSTDLSDDIL